MTINLKETIGEYCMTYAAGGIIYDIICRSLLEDKKVVIDFTDTITTTSFLNAAIGQLLRDFSPVVLNTQIECVGLSQVRRIALVNVIDNTKIFYGVLDDNSQQQPKKGVSNGHENE